MTQNTPYASQQTTDSIAPFWERINVFFLFPFQREPLLYALVLALSGLLANVLVMIPTPFEYLLIGLGVTLAASRYGFKVMEQASQGQFASSEFPNGLNSDLVHLPWKMFGIFFIFGTVTGLADALLPALGWLVDLLLSLSLPAAMVALLLTSSLRQALLPLSWLALMQSMGWSYLALCLFLFLLSAGGALAAPLLLAVVSPSLFFPVLIFCGVYFTWVMCSLLGYVIYQHHEALGYEPQFRHAAPGSSATERADMAQKRQQREEEAHYAELLAEGDVAAARALAYEAQRMQPQDVSAHQRYHRILLLDDNSDRLCDHAQTYLRLLMQRKQYREAIELVFACRERNPIFAPETASFLVELGRYALRAHEPNLCIRLINGFDKRYPGTSSEMAEVYELAVRAMLQLGGPREKSQQIATLLQRRYPEHPSTKEVLWLLR